MTKFSKTNHVEIRDGISESNDCTVQAFTNATGIPYPRVWAAFRSNGRKAGRGVKLADKAQSVAHSLGVKLTLVRRSGTLRKLLSDYPEGRFIVRVRRHAFAVVSGIVIDSWEQKPGRQIKSAWRVAA